ncbi:MAG: hypothetical protein Kow0027_07210 [Saprospiraceae bacterium]
MKKLFILLAIPLLLLEACITAEQTYTLLPPGRWRAVLKIQNQYITPNPKAKPLPDKVNMKYEDVTPGELPFNFDVVYDNDSTFHIEIINGEERLVVPAEDISFGRSRSRARDTIRIDFPIYSSYISANYAGGVIEGEWVVTTRENYSIPFVAHHGKDYRFATVKKEAAANLTGKWEATFGLDEEEPYPAIGEFSQNGNHLTGTFLTETGDYRYLEGTVLGNKFWLSTFDGSHAFLFEGKIQEDGTLTGAFYSGKHYRTTWEAKRNDNARLTPPDSLTFLNPGYERFTFSFKNPEGKLISPDDPIYEGKVKIIQIMGTWCPNCRDETMFLVDYLKNEQPDDVAVIALAFEKHKDEAKAMQALRTYKERFNMPYEIALAGPASKDGAAKALPMLNHVLAYPTMIILDKNNRVRRIHTGFSGPATSEFASFKTEFMKFIDELRAEQS